MSQNHVPVLYSYERSNGWSLVRGFPVNYGLMGIGLDGWSLMRGSYKEKNNGHSKTGLSRGVVAGEGVA